MAAIRKSTHRPNVAASACRRRTTSIAAPITATTAKNRRGPDILATPGTHVSSWAPTSRTAGTAQSCQDVGLQEAATSRRYRRNGFIVIIPVEEKLVVPRMTKAVLYDDDVIHPTGRSSRVDRASRS
jgi:hypothetical protein